MAKDSEDIGEVGGRVATDPVDVAGSLGGSLGDAAGELSGGNDITADGLADVPVLAEDAMEGAAGEEYRV